MAFPTSSDRVLLLSVDDLTDLDVRRVLDSARRYRHRGRSAWPSHPPTSSITSPTVGLLFLTPSLRTRVGFSVATAHLGGVAVDVLEARWTSGMSAAERFLDTLRSASGMVDVVVVRSPAPLDRTEVASSSVGPVINGGDPGGEHPTQALIDLFAVEELKGPISEQRIGICGDLGARAVRSLVKLLGRFPPRGLTLMAPDGRDDPKVALGPELASRTTRRAMTDLGELDVLYMAGLPEGSGSGRLDAKARQRYCLTGGRVKELPREAVVLCPLPAIDEIDDEARCDPRIAMFGQNDIGVAVRMGVLELVLGSGSAAVSPGTWGGPRCPSARWSP